MLGVPLEHRSTPGGIRSRLWRLPRDDRVAGSRVRAPLIPPTACAECHLPPPSHTMEHFSMVSRRLSGQAKARLAQCFLCHDTTAWNDIWARGESIITEAGLHGTGAHCHGIGPSMCWSSRLLAAEPLGWGLLAAQSLEKQ
jgi:hypothetical protein